MCDFGAAAGHVAIVGRAGFTIVAWWCGDFGACGVTTVAADVAIMGRKCDTWWLVL